ncbi:MAG: hypothetical protein JXA10_12330 [Anaerolineae bacterium]|nr:hypothetical protein [Anaerolineae bacterium]
MRNFLKWLVPSVILSNLTFGYLDPGSGSFIIQILVAGLFGMLLSIKMFWHQIIGIFKRKPADAEIEPPDESTPTA